MANVCEFVKHNIDKFDLSSIPQEEKQALAEKCVHEIEKCSETSAAHRLLHVQCLRILTRDKVLCQNYLSEKDTLRSILKCAHLLAYGEQPVEVDNPVVELLEKEDEGEADVVCEGVKVLCNLCFNHHPTASTESAKICCRGVLNRSQVYSAPEITPEIMYYDMRLLFLLTALDPTHRGWLLTTLRGLVFLERCIRLHCPLVVEEEREKPGEPPVLDDVTVDFLCEVLKCAFNVAYGRDPQALITVLLAEDLERIALACRDLLDVPCRSLDKRMELTQHVVNLMTALPGFAMTQILHPPKQDGTAPSYRRVECMRTVLQLLRFLKRQLEQPNPHESLTPILNVLSTAARENRNIRKYCRAKVLPPLKTEVKRLPEDGTTLRNRLVRLFTNPIQEVTELAAYFVFILCKESVSRCIKYTGYGNFAGFLVRHGLLSEEQRHAVHPPRPGKEVGDVEEEEKNSSTSDSETEEYAQLKERVNPVTGRWEEEKPDPMADWSDERKEYEAMRLVNQIDQLMRAGVIQPATVDEEGQLKPMEHVQQLSSSSGFPRTHSDEDENDCNS